jgi:hypothetical protein
MSVRSFIRSYQLNKEEEQPFLEHGVNLVELGSGNFGFDEDNYEFWEHVAPKQLIELLEGSSAKVEWDLYERRGVVGALAKLKEAVPPAKWQTVLSKLVPTCWLCIEGDDWDPRILDNGGVLIRNYHRARSMDLDYGASISGVKTTQLRPKLRSLCAEARRQQTRVRYSSTTARTAQC